MTVKWTDLGLSYEAAAHRMQTDVALKINNPAMNDTQPKHLRVGINSAMVRHAALAWLLIKKGIITEDEYREEVRLAMNHELSTYEADHPGMTLR